MPALTRVMSARLFTDWMQFAALEPFGDNRADYHAALIAMVIANVNRDSKRKPQPFKINDFLLRWKEANTDIAGTAHPPRKQTWQEQKALFLAIAKAYATKEPAPVKRRPRQ